MACSGTRERDLARKYNLECLSVNITRISKEQLDFYQINKEKCTGQVLQFDDIKLEPSESFCYPQNSETAEIKLDERENFSETSVKCLIKRETSDFSSNLHHNAAMDQLQDDEEYALTSELIIKSEEFSIEDEELEEADDSDIRQNLEAESVSQSQAQDGLQDELFIKSELECSEGKDTQESAGSEGGDLCQAWRRTVQQNKVIAACDQQVCHQIKMESKENTHSTESSKQKETENESDLIKIYNLKCLSVKITRLSETELDKVNKDNKTHNNKQASSEIEHTELDKVNKDNKTHNNVQASSEIEHTELDKVTKNNKTHNNVQASSEIEQTKGQPYSCRVCDKTLSKKGNLLRHIKQVHEAVRSLQCNLCSQSFISKKRLENHLRAHSNDRPFKVCGKMIKSKFKVKNHMPVLTMELNFKCRDCDKKFKSKRLLEQHKRSHSNLRPFPCGQCDVRLKTRPDLSRHLITHSNLRPFACVQCDKRYKRRSDLSAHLSVHSEVRPFSCHICAVSLKSKASLKRHSIVHSSTCDFTCNLCTAKFKRKSYVLRHKKTVHSDARYFKCYDCGKSFKSKSNLLIHILAHLNLRQFQCKKCDKKFNNISNLIRHNLLHARTYNVIAQ